MSIRVRFRMGRFHCYGENFHHSLWRIMRLENDDLQAEQLSGQQTVGMEMDGIVEQRQTEA